MKPRRGPTADGSSLKRTFPSKKKPGETGGAAARKPVGMLVSKKKRGKNNIDNNKEDTKAKKNGEGGKTKKDAFLSQIFKKEGIEYTEDMKMMVYRKCYFLLHGIARIHMEELAFSSEYKDNLFFSRVKLPYLDVAINPSHADNELDSHMIASYSFFKFLIATCGIIDNPGKLIVLILKSSELELGLVAIEMNKLLLSFSAAFGSSVSNGGRVVLDTRKRHTFDQVKGAITLKLESILDDMDTRRIEVILAEKNAQSYLAKLYCEVDKNGMQKNGSRKVFESSDEDNDYENSQASAICGAKINRKGEGEEKEISKNIKRERDDDNFSLKKVKEEVESEDEIKNYHNEEKWRSGSINGWDEDMEEEEEGYDDQPSTSHSTSEEFRSNLKSLARYSWKKSMGVYSVKQEPSVKNRFKMSQFIIECLEKTYGAELFEIIQYFTFQSFTPSFTSAEEAIGLLLYLDQRLFIGNDFFFLLLVTNDKDIVRMALEESEICCRAQLKAAKIGRSLLLGKPLQVEHLAANKEAESLRKGLESTKYHIFFEGIISKHDMKKLICEKREADREMEKESRLKSTFVEPFWTTSATLFNVTSEWTTYEVNKSAIRVFHELNKMFEGSLLGLVRTMSGRIKFSDSSLNDARKGQSLMALYRMRNAGFFDDSLLFALLRFDHANAMEKSLNKLSKLCEGFKKLVEAGTKSKGLKTDSKFLTAKDNFTQRALQVNADCIQFFEGLMRNEGRKRCIPSITEDEEEKEKEPRRKKMKEVEDDHVEEKKLDNIKITKEKDEDEDRDCGIEKMKEEAKNEEKSERKKDKKVKKKEKSDDESEECAIIEVGQKKVKIEVISDDEEKEKEMKRERRYSKRSVKENDCENKQKGEENKCVYSIGMEGDGEIDDEEEGDSRNEYAGYTNLMKVREMLVGMSEYWETGLKTWNVSSEPSIDDRFKIAKKVIHFYENEFGDKFHNALFNSTHVHFTPSDLHEKSEVIGLVLYMDKMRLSISFFYFFILAMNDVPKSDNILVSCKESLQIYLEYHEKWSKFNQGEIEQSEKNRSKKAVTIEGRKLKKKLPYYFGDICMAYDSEEGQLMLYGTKKKVERMKHTVFGDGLWEKYIKKYGIKREWSSYDVCGGAVMVLNQLNKLFRGSLFSEWKAICPSIPIDEINNFTRTAFLGLMYLHKIKIFPDGFIFLLVMSKNEKVVNKACSFLSVLVPQYSKFFRDFGPDFNYKLPLSESNIQDRSLNMRSHDANQKCMEFLLTHIKKENSSVCDVVSTSHYPLETSIPPSDESLWKYNSKWKVTTFWSQSCEWKEWEKNHSSDMDRLSDRMNNFMIITAMREEHYEKKVKVCDWLKIVLKSEIERTESTLDIVGSSLCLVGAANSNLDLFLYNNQNHKDLNALMEILKKEKGILLRPFRKMTIHMVVNNEVTEGSDLFISIHISPSTPYMARVYQMADAQDERVSSLSLVIKAWSILEPSCVTAKLRSYHVMSMLLHFLQCGVSPPILPSLTQFYPNLDPTLYRSLPLPEPVPQENTQSSASLLIGFFTYFSHFDFDKYIISIREGYLFKKNVVGEGSVKEKLLMKHPFGNSLKESNGGFVSTEVDYGHIRSSCKRALESLTSTFNVPFLSVL